MHLARIVDRCTVTQRNSCSCEGDGASAGPIDGESSEVSKCQKWNRQCVLYLTVFALFLTSYGYDPYLRDQELEVLVADDEDDGVLYRSPSAYHDPDAEEQEDEELEVHFHILLYLPRIVAVIAFMFSELSNISRATLQKIVHFGHLLVALLYTLLHLPNFLSYELRFIGCISELFWAVKLYLYLYQLVVYSPAAERLHFLIAGMLATSLGSASHPFVAQLGSSYPFLSQYILNLIISILHVALFQPMMFCSGRFAIPTAPVTPAPSSRRLLNLFIAEILILVVALNTIVLQCHITRTAGWLPPIENWVQTNDLPYGWEKAIDQKGQPYYINHLNKTTTYEEPIRHHGNDSPPEPRVVVLQRSPTLGFGFVAGSEKPVIVRFVTEGGPSVNKLEPGDQILAVNGEDVKDAPRDHVIQLVRNCETSVTLLVCQPQLYNAVGRKSTLLSAGKKAKLKSRPIRVRFAESVCVNGAPLFPPSAFSLGDLCVPPMANVLKVFLENGQTKSFKYDSTTTVQNVVTSLRDKLCLTAGEHFSLVVEHVKSLKRNKLTLLDPQETVARIAARPGAHKLRCLFRVTFVPVSAAALAQKDLNALDYLFLQCCNDVTQERFAPELQPEVALRLAALHMHQHALANNISPAKLTVKTVEREFGLDRFVPASLIEGMKRKELRRLLGHFLKLNSQMTGSSTKMLTQLQAKIHYLDIISGLPSYGAKCFSTNQRDGVERVLLVSPRFGLSQIAGVRNTVPQPICNLEELIRVVVTRDDDISNTVTVFITPDRVINFAMEDRDASEFAIVLAGYYRLMAGKELPLEQERETQIEDIAPPYLSQHTVVSNGWSYLPTEKQTHSIAFLMPPPYHSTGFRSATGSISSSSRSDECDRNANSARMSNRNARPSLKEYDFESAQQGNKDVRVSKDGMATVGGVGRLGGIPGGVPEARNEEVLRRVAEMQKLVENSERYLNEHGEYGHEFEVKPGGKLNFWRETSVDVDESDCESLNSSKQSSTEDGPGVLKHSDSLTLLTETINQGLDGIAKGLSSIYTAPFSELNGKLDHSGGAGSAQNTPKSQRKISGLSQILSDLQALGNDLSQSESDSESLYTPNSSPIHKTTQNVSQSLQQQQQQQQQQAQMQTQQGNLRNKSIRTSFGLHSPDSTADGRDMNLKDYLRQLKEASSASELGSEGTDLAAKKLGDLYGYELLGDESIIETDPDIIDLRSIPPPQTPDELDNLNVLSVAPSGFDDRSGAGKPSGPSTASNIQPPNVSGAGDLEEFLKQVTIEPPTQKITPAVELTPEEILSYIIPPPPGLGDRSDAAPEPQNPPRAIATVAPVQNHSTGSANGGMAHLGSSVSQNNNINTLKNLNYADGGPVPKPRMVPTNGNPPDPRTLPVVANGAISSALLAKYAYDPSRFEVYYPPELCQPNGANGTLASHSNEYDLYSNSEAASAAATVVQEKTGDANGTHDPKNPVANGTPANGHVIEYPTVDRKGPFSCCAKSKSKDKANGEANPEPDPEQQRQKNEPHLALPPKPCPHAAANQPSPPQRPPKSAELQLRLGSPIRSPPAAGYYARVNGTGTGNYYEMDPPSLPPRFEQSPPPSVMLAILPPKKPPLPPVPLKPCILRSPVPILKNPHAFNHQHQHLQHFQHHLTHATPPPHLPHHLQHHPHLTSVGAGGGGGVGGSLSANSSPVRTAGIGSPHFHRNPNCYREIERAFNHQDLAATTAPTAPTGATAATTVDKQQPPNGHHRSHSDCPPVCLKNPPADSRAQLTLLCSPQLSRKTSLPTAGPSLPPGPAGTVTFSNPGSPILSNKNGHVLNVDTLMAKTDVAMAGLLVKLDQVAALCSAAQTAGGGTSIDEDRFQQAKDELTDQSLQLVTASKHLVVSMSDANLTNLPEHLTACLSALRRITELAQDLTRYTSAPLQTRNIVLKIHDVASSFRELAGVRVGPAGAGQLALNAECLANVLATLLRSLRVFSP